MKTPISYYGGKQMMAAEILKMIPLHKQYIEPFVGGGLYSLKKKKVKTKC